MFSYDTAIFIPARIGGTRFPDKMLEEIDGVPVIKYVYDKLVETKCQTLISLS